MPAIRRKLLIEQGASLGTDQGLFTWHNPRGIFKVVVPTSSSATGLSGAIEPVWPSANCDCDQIVDNELTWACERQATETDWRTAKSWCADTEYARDDEIITPPSPRDITGYTARMQFRTGPADDPNSEVLFEMTNVADVDGNVILLGDAAGTIQIVLQAATTETFEWEEAEYDLEIVETPTATYPTGYVRRLLEGVVTVSKERTRL